MRLDVMRSAFYLICCLTGGLLLEQALGAFDLEGCWARSWRDCIIESANVDFDRLLDKIALQGVR